LGSGETADRQNTKDQQTGERTLKHGVFHSPHSIRTGAQMVLEFIGESQR
jgi:hypothetical protein